MDSKLAGTDGQTICQLSAGGHQHPVGQPEAAKRPPGEGVRLTIDRDVQWYAEQGIGDAVAKARADAGIVVVMDTETCELVAMATSPATYDPPRPTTTAGATARSRTVRAGRCSQALTMAAVIEAGAADLSTELSVPTIERAAAR